MFNPLDVSSFIFKDPELKFLPDLTICFDFRVAVHSPSSLALGSKNKATH